MCKVWLVEPIRGGRDADATSKGEGGAVEMECFTPGGEEAGVGEGGNIRAAGVIAGKNAYGELFSYPTYCLLFPMRVCMGLPF